MTEPDIAKWEVIELQPNILGALKPPEKPKPEDEKDLFIVKTLLIIFGTASLIPWNITINAAGYYMIRLKGTAFETSFPSYIQFVGIIANLISSVAAVFLIKIVPVRILVFVSSVMMTVPVVVHTLLARLNTDGWADEFFIVTLIAQGVYTSGIGMLTSAVSGLVSMISPELLKSYYIGQGVAGIIAVAVTLVTVSFPGLDVEQAAFYYFLVTTILGVVVVFLMYKFINMEYVVQGMSNKKCDVDEETEEILSTFELIKRGKDQCIAEFLHLLVALTVFPAISTNVRQIDPEPGTPWSDVYFLPVSVFLMYGLGDGIGKITSSFFLWPGRKLIVILSFVELLFIPMIIMCNVQPRTIPVWFNHDIFPPLIIFATGLSTGHMISLSVAYAPTYVEGKANKSRLSTIIFFMMSMGMALASSSIFLITKLINL